MLLICVPCIKLPAVLKSRMALIFAESLAENRTLMELAMRENALERYEEMGVLFGVIASIFGVTSAALDFDCFNLGTAA